MREVSPQADPATRTFQVKVGIIDPPEAMRLGSTVTGRIKLSAPSGVQVPPSALTEANGRPAVWVVDPKSQTVSLRNVDVSRYDPADVVVSQGLDTGEIVVTAGVQTLHPGQKVRLLGGAPDEALQPLRMGAPAPVPRDLFHARHRGRGHLVLPPARAERGSGLHRQDHGGAGRMAGRHGQPTRSSRSPTASKASSRRRRTSIT